MQEKTTITRWYLTIWILINQCLLSRMGPRITKVRYRKTTGQQTRAHLVVQFDRYLIQSFDLILRMGFAAELVRDNAEHTGQINFEEPEIEFARRNR